MKTTRTLVIAAALAAIALAVIAGCNNAPTNEPSQTKVTPQNATPNDTGTIVAFRNDAGELVCPVMGSVIKTEEDAVGHQDYEGKRYYFCCGDCPEQFKANPEKFTKK